MRIDFKTGTFYLGDCFDVMAALGAGSVDMVLNDPPYGTTQNKWDAVIPFEPMWAAYWRLLKSNGAAVLMAAQPFTSALVMSQVGRFRYNWVWDKGGGGNFLSAAKQPLRSTEDVCVFYVDLASQQGAAPEYAPLREYFKTQKQASGLSAKEISCLLGNQMGSHYFTEGVQFSIPTSENYQKLQKSGFFQRPYSEILKEYNFLGHKIRPVTYNPQKETGHKAYRAKPGGNSANYGAFSLDYETVSNGSRFPKTLLPFPRDKGGLHPTQKPVALFEYLIRTYTNPGELVLDNTAGSGTTAVAALQAGRRWVCIERDPEYFAKAIARVYDAEAAL